VGGGSEEAHMDGKRGRKGQFGGIVPLAPWNEGDYPSPPKDLPEPEAATWKNTVRAMKPRWFHPACFPMLRSYCFTVWASEQLATKLRTATIDEGAADLLDQYDRMTRLMLTLATKLRITPKSNREGVYTGFGSPATRRPWEDDDDDQPPRRKLWERDEPTSDDPLKPDA